MGAKKVVLAAIALAMLVSSMASFSSAVNNDCGQTVEISEISQNNYMKQSVNFYYSEWMNTWIHHDGWIHSDVTIEGIGISLGDLNMWDLPTIYKDNLDWLHLNTWDNHNPYDINSHLNIRFQGISLNEATNAADLLITVLEQFMIVDFHYDGFNSYDDWNGAEWVEILEIWYSGHIDWTNVVQTYENAIPRENGGIAETIDVSNATGFRFEAWYDGWQNDFVGRIGFNFNPYLQNLSGSHEISLKDIFCVDYFETSPLADNPLNIYVALPDVTGLSINPWYNDSYLYMEQHYHPNIDEPWNKNHIYDISINLEEGLQLNDITLSFDYEFEPWGKMTQERAEIYIDPRGYAYRRLDFQGDNAVLMDTTFDESLLENVSYLHLNYEPDAYNVAGHSNLYMDIYFMDNIIHDAEAMAIAEYIELKLGITFENNWTWDSSYWDHYTQTSVECKAYGFEIENLTNSAFSNIFTNSLAYQNSAMISSSSLATDYTSIRWNVYRDWQFDYFGYSVEVIKDSLDYYVQTAIKEYADSGSPMDFTLDTLDVFGWTELPYIASSEYFHIEYTLPVTTGTQIEINPDKPNGWGYNYWYHTEYRDQFTYGRLGVDYYTETPYTTDYDGIKLDPVTNWNVNFNNQFVSDSVDIDPPGIHGISKYSSGWDYDIYSQGFSGNTLIGVDVDDESSNRYYDEVLGYETNRFPNSGITEVEGNLFYSNLPVDIPGLYEPLAFEYNTSASRYTTYVDFSSGDFADGDWELEINAEDNNGNMAYRFETITVDNYDDMIYNTPASITWTTNAPIDGTDVSGNITVEFEVSDDIGEFLVVLWVNFGGWVLEDSDNDGIYSKEIDTNYFFEGPMEIIVEVWDMEGHYTAETLSLTVDNVPTGNEPTINIISPIDGDTVTGMMLVQAEVIDDIGINTVLLQINDRSPLVMAYNESSGYYEITFDTNQISNGYHMLTIKAIDLDENTHVVYETIGFSVYGSTGTEMGLAPEYNLVNVPINQTQEELMDQLNEVKDESKAVVGIFNWELELSDDVGISQVVLTLDDEEVYVMQGSDAGPNMWSMWTLEWDSAEFNDGAHVAVISITDIDENQHEVEITIGFTTLNGNTGEMRTIGLDGFNYLWALVALIPLAMVIKFKKRV